MPAFKRELFEFCRVAADHYQRGFMNTLIRVIWLRMRHQLMLSEIEQYDLLSRNLGAMAPTLRLANRKVSAWQRRINPEQLGNRVDLKPRFYSLCSEAGLRVPETYHTGKPNENLLLNLPERFLVKPVLGGGGFGVSAYTRDVDAFRGTDGMTFSAAALCRHLSTTTEDRDLIFQEWIRPAPELEGLTDLALPTVRTLVLSPRAPGGSRILVTMLRVPASGRIIDNISYGEAGQQWVQLDTDTGQALAAYCTQMSGFGFQPLSHVGPSNSVSVEGLRITGWSSIQTMAYNLAALFPEMGCLGFDIGLSETGPVAIEGNTQWGVPPLPAVYPEMVELLKLRF